MFDKLRNKFILTNIIITTAILITAFSSIFAITAANLPTSPSLPSSIGRFDRDTAIAIHTLLKDRISQSNAEHLARLSISLLIVGICVEAVVFIASYYMAEKSIQPIKAAYYRQKEFIANASHELKTPIAIVQANFEALSVREQPWAGNIESNLSRANHLIGDFLTLARLDTSSHSISKSKTNLSALVQKQISQFQPKLSTKQLKTNLPPNINATLNTSDFTQIINILLDNAIKYSDQSIHINLEQKTFFVSNDGPTIPKSKLPKIFDRFYQADKTSEGSGLGLAIAKTFADKNHWTLSVTSQKNLTTFRLDF